MADVRISDIPVKDGVLSENDSIEVSSLVTNFVSRTDSNSDTQPDFPEDTYSLETAISNDTGIVYEIDPPLEINEISMSAGLQSESDNFSLEITVTLIFENNETFTFRQDSIPFEAFSTYTVNDPNPDPTYTSPSYDIVANVADIAFGRSVKSITISALDTTDGNAGQIWDLSFGYTTLKFLAKDLFKTNGSYGDFYETGDIVLSSKDLSGADVFLPGDGRILFQSEQPELFNKIGLIDQFESGKTKNNISGLPVLTTVNSGAWSIDGSVLAINNDSKISIIDTSDWSVSQEVTLPSVGQGDVIFSPDGKYLAAGVTDSPYMVIVDTETWTIVPGTPVIPDGGQGWNNVRILSFSPNGKRLAVGHAGSPIISIIDTSDWRLEPDAPVEAVTVKIRGLAWSPDGSYLALQSDSSDGTVLLDAIMMSVINDIPSGPGSGDAVTFSPDGAFLVLGYDSAPYFRVLDTSDWSTISTGLTFTGPVTSVSFSPDGKYLVIGSSLDDFLIIDTETWSIISGVSTPSIVGANPRYIKYSPNGEKLLLVDSPNYQVLSGDSTYDISTEFKLPNVDTSAFSEGVSAWIKS